MSEIKALPEAQEVWDNPADMLAMWDGSESKHRHEHMVAGWVGVAGHVVDLGCGAGRYARLLTCRQYLGVDASTPMIIAAKSQENARAKFMTADIFRYMPATEFNVAIMMDVAQHQEDPVGSILRVLELWKADRYIFSLLVGDARERLLNSVVVAWSELFPVLNRHEIIRMHPEPSPDGSPFAWVLMEVFGGSE